MKTLRMDVRFAHCLCKYTTAAINLVHATSCKIKPSYVMIVDFEYVRASCFVYDEEGHFARSVIEG